MPRAKSNQSTTNEKRTQNGDKNFTLPTFVSCELNDEERSYCKQHVLNLSEVSSRLEDLLTEGFKLTLSWDDNSDCALATLIGTPKQATNRGLALSARGGSLEGSLTVLFYKHFEKLKEDWTNSPSQKRFDQWG